MKIKLGIILILLISLLSSACGHAAVQLVSTEAVMLAVSVTPSKAKSPTRTPTPTPTWAPFQTWTPFPTWTLNQTQSFDLTSQAEYPEFNQECSNYEIAQNLSPDGNWTFCDKTESIEVLNKTGKKWTLSYQDYFGSEFYGYTHLVAWTQDSQSLYFAPMATIDGIYPIPYNGLALFVIDISNGKIKTILAGDKNISDPHFYILSISPTGRRLAYIYEISALDPIDINILDLKTGEEKIIKLNSLYSNAGWFSWSEDGTELSFEVYDSGSQHFYKLTYDITALRLVKSKVFTPSWIAEGTQYFETLTTTSTP